MKSPRLLPQFLLLLLFLPALSYCSPAELLIDTFSSCASAGLPCGWKKFKETKGVALMYESGDWFVRIQSARDVEGIAKKISYAPDSFPVLKWRWRAHTLPLNGREDIKNKDDSPAGVYVVFKGMAPFNKILKYVWSATLPVGTVTKSPYNGRTMIFVIESGKDKMATWVSEQRNVAEDFRSAFGSRPPDVEGIAIMTDSDNTKSSATADYDDFRASAAK